MILRAEALFIVIVTSSPLPGAPTGDHVIEAYAIFAVIVQLLAVPNALLQAIKPIINSIKVHDFLFNNSYFFILSNFKV